MRNLKVDDNKMEEKIDMKRIGVLARFQMR